jgi:hypothetical protein
VSFRPVAAGPGLPGRSGDAGGTNGSSHAIQRFFRAFNIFHAAAFRWVWKELLVWRPQLQKPRVVVMTLDTMVMDNDEASKRQGCHPTYKKIKGFQPLQLIWEGKIVLFSGGASGTAITARMWPRSSKES